MITSKLFNQILRSLRGNVIKFLPVLIFSLTTCCKFTYAQEIDVSRLEFARLIDPKYSIYEYKRGDLNLDSFLDYLVIVELKWEYEDVEETSPKYELLVITGAPKNNFLIKARSSQLVEDLEYKDCRPCPIIDNLLQVEKGQFNLTVASGGSSAGVVRRLKFIYDENKINWILKSIRSRDYHYIHDKNDQVVGREQSRASYRSSRDFGFMTIEEYSSDFLYKALKN